MTSNVDDTDLVKQLFRLQKKSPKLCKSTLYDAPEQPGIKVRSWKMAEHHYYTVPSPFPTYARGIFTSRITGKDEDGGDERAQYRIVARGYDKFFNMGEVPWSTWDAIAKYTEPPYTLSVKSNGCIIFIAALTSDKLLITSKHSIGNTQGSGKSHSQVGEEWLEKHLASVGRTREQLAKTLWENQWTAVAELCDDNFEEHVLAYSEEVTGLHLHGLNKNSPAFVTVPSSNGKEGETTVDSFAAEWGFIRTVTLEMNDIDKVKEFTDECAKTGSWNNEAIEGFVVRTHIKMSNRSAFTGQDAPPYPPGANFFFKIKFDEPYMMYRDWREITKSYLSVYDKEGGMGLKKSKATKQRLRRAETRVYDTWVRKKIVEEPDLFNTYRNNRGIVKTRQIFLEWLATPAGATQLAKEKGEKISRPPSPDGTEEPKDAAPGKAKTIIVPVAIPGCGKTTVGLALAKLFRFGHTQSDDVPALSKKTKTAKIFEGNVRALLESDRYSVVIADKNNHLVQHRSALRALLPNNNPPVRLIALHWSPSATTNAEIHRMCGERIRSRGGNHQTLRPDPDAPDEYEKVLWMFIKGTEELEAHEVDDVIEMSISDSIEESVKRAVEGLCKLLPLEKPSEEAIKEAIKHATAYEVPSNKKRVISVPKAPSEEPKKNKKDKGPPRYFGLTPYDFDSSAIASLMEKVVSENPSDTQLSSLWKKMKTKYVAHAPHVTIVHKNNLEDGNGERELWDDCMESTTTDTCPEYRMKITHVVFNDRVAGLVVENLKVDGESTSDPLERLDTTVRDSLHITAGTREGSIRPIEARDLIRAWRKGTMQDGTAIKLGEEIELRLKLERLWS